MKRMKIALVMLAFFFLHADLYAHSEKGTDADLAEVGITPQLGRTIPLDLVFKDEEGHPVTLGKLIHAPTILALVYLHCPNVCSLLLQNLAGVLNELPAEPGEAYLVLTVSFDETETPALAAEKKRLYLKMIGRPFPAEDWKFLTGDAKNIRNLAEAVGFHFKRQGEDFLHPVSVIVLSPQGKITRYLYGADVLPLDLKLALIEASHGTIGPAISKVVQFCFA